VRPSPTGYRLRAGRLRVGRLAYALLCLALRPIHHIRHPARWTALQSKIAAGTLRAGLDAETVILALAGLWQLDPTRDRRAKADRRHRVRNLS
jgi:hypothetical protein